MSYNKFLHEQQLEVFNQLVGTFQLKLAGKRILEIGPGHGFWTHFFQSQDVARYTGIDISEQAIDNLKQQFKTYSFQCGDIGSKNAVSLGSNAVDLAFAAMVFLHITDNAKIEQSFETIANSLVDGGHFILLDAIASKNVFGKQLKEADGDAYDTIFHDKIRYKNDIERIAKLQGLELLNVIPAFNLSQGCFDYHTYLGYLVWSRLYFPIHRRILENCSEKNGRIYAKFQRFADTILTKNLRLSMSSKWLIFQKIK